MANEKNLKPWPKGRSGNPSGRPKKAETLKQLGELIRAYQNETDASGKSRWLKQIQKLARTERGIKLLWEYSVGKVPDVIQGTGKDGALLMEIIQKKTGVDTSKI